jgi:hypothetical protein
LRNGSGGSQIVSNVDNGAIARAGRRTGGIAGAVPWPWAACLVAFAIYAAAQAGRVSAVADRVLRDGDDAARLLSVRALDAGQSWFDTTQARVLPPDGISMHWSRWVDAGLIAMLDGFRAVLAPAAAETAMLIAWPALLFAAFLVLTFVTARRIAGDVAAGVAALVAATAPLLVDNWFAAGRIDHHNVQVLATLAMTAALLAPGQGARTGAAAGLAAAMSLAVGLETVFAAAAAGGVLGLAWVLGRQGSARALLGFAAVFLTGVVAFHLGQTAPAEWLVARCDALSAPWILVVAAGAAAVVVLAALDRHLATTASRLLTAAIVGVAVTAVAAPTLSICAGGPYGALPPQARAIISGGITEALPVWNALALRPFVWTAAAGPVAVAIVGLAVLLVRSSTPAALRTAAVVLLAPLSVGFLAGQVQLRAFSTAIAVLPVAAGVLVAVAGTLASSPARRVAAMVATALALLAQPWALAGFALAHTTVTVGERDADCRAADAFAGLAGLEPTRVLAPLNLGMPILLHTGHDVLAAPYHRSAAAILNGVTPFEGDEAALAGAVIRNHAGVVVVCRGETYGRRGSIGTRLAGGDGPAWLVPVGESDDRLVVLRVDQAGATAAAVGVVGP